MAAKGFIVLVYFCILTSVYGKPAAKPLKPCVVDGMTIQPGHPFYRIDCSRICLCGGGDIFTCKELCPKTTCADRFKSENVFPPNKDKVPEGGTLIEIAERCRKVTGRCWFGDKRKKRACKLLGKRLRM